MYKCVCMCGVRCGTVLVKCGTSSQRMVVVTCQMDTCLVVQVTMNQEVYAVRWWAMQPALSVSAVSRCSLCWLSSQASALLYYIYHRYYFAHPIVSLGQLTARVQLLLCGHGTVLNETHFDCILPDHLLTRAVNILVHIELQLLLS